MPAFVSGSPPRTWGRRAAEGTQIDHGRFTPTHVGKTTGLTAAAIRDRFTPTHVGKTIDFTTRACPITVHPHARGEDSPTCQANGLPSGSPPRTWGRLCQCAACGACGRFTPTHVGKTPKHMAAPAASPVHPHARGEDTGWRMLSVGIAGSPPRTWGRRGPHLRRAELLRFTPTHVGKTTLGSGEYSAKEVHPHARGEDSITPPPGARTSVHPHARGEDPCCQSLTRPSAGSPPRTWGIPRHRRRAGQVVGSPPRTWGRHRRVVQFPFGHRFTPTHVGKTGAA